MSDTIKIEIPKDGTMPNVEGEQAIAVSIENSGEPGTLRVKMTCTPVGDDALHAGSMEAVFTLVAPEFVDQSDLSTSEQAEIGGQYAKAMVDAMVAMVGEHLAPAFNDAAVRVTKDIVDGNDPDDMVNMIAAVAMALAALLIHKHGSKDEAIKHADPRTDPDVAKAAAEAGLDDATLALLTDTVVEAIKLADV